MADWRDRGFVPDSDDEEEVSLQTNGNHIATQGAVDPEESGTVARIQPDVDDLIVLADHDSFNGKSSLASTSPKGRLFDHVEIPARTTAEKLHDELQRGLETCREVARNHGQTSFLDHEDSPLSSLAPTPSQSPTRNAETLSEIRLPESAKSLLTASSRIERDADQALPPREASKTPFVDLMDIEDLPFARTSRSLRPRTLLQLNPYSLEYARYRQDCERRGLAPVKLANFAAERARADAVETQGSAAFNSDNRASSPIGLYSPIVPALEDYDDESQSPVRAVRPTLTRLGSDDELPDVADILGGKVETLPAARKKKAKKNLPARSEPTLKTSNGFRRHSEDSDLTGVFDLPLSSPRSGTASPEQIPIYVDEEDPSQATTPRPLPTPVLSSDKQNLKRKVIDILSSSSRLTPDIEDADAEANLAESSDADHDTQGIVQIRRKIKGVLPASWLKLDAKRQDKNKPQPRTSMSPEKGGPARGIAKHVIGSQTQRSPGGTATRGLMWSSDLDDSASDQEENALRRPAVLSRVSAQSSDSDLEMDGVVVEDHVDAMAPSAPRAHFQSKPKKQKRLSETWTGSSSRPASNRNGTSYGLQFPRPKLSNPVKTKRVKRRHQAVQLTVLEAPDFASARSQPQTSFLRIAARRPLNKQTPRPQNPKSKFFRLATRQDTTDINHDLKDWHSGRVRRHGPSRLTNTISAKHAQLLYSGQTQNQRAHTVRGEQTIDELKSRTAQTLRELRFTSSRGHQTPLPRAAAFHRRASEILFAQVAVKHGQSVPRWLSGLGPSTGRGLSQKSPTFKSSGDVVSAVPLVRPTPTPTAQLHAIPQKDGDVRVRKSMPRHRPLPARSMDGDQAELLMQTDSPVKRPIETSAEIHDTQTDLAFAAWAVNKLSLDADTMDHSKSAAADHLPESSVAIGFESFSRTRLLSTYLGFNGGVEGAPADQATLTQVQRIAEDVSSLPLVLDYLDTQFQSPITCLAATILVVHILSVQSIARAAQREGQSSSQSDNDWWALLQPPLNVFMTMYRKLSNGTHAVHQSLAVAAIRLCHVAVSRWHWKSSDSIVKFWFKLYAENNMIELMIPPKLEANGSREDRRNSSIALAADSTDFDVFLKMLAVLLNEQARTMSLSGTTGRTASRIQSLVFSLSPNNSRKLSDDQSLSLEDLVSMGNIYALYEHLNHYAADGCQPRFTSIEKLIDFPNCHWSICRLALDAWKSITIAAIDRGELRDINQSGLWMKRTILQMVEKYSGVHQTVPELRLSGQQFAVRENAASTCDHILVMLQVWKDTLETCPTDVECRALLGAGDIEDVILLCKGTIVQDDRIVLVICSIMGRYLEKSGIRGLDNFRDDLHKQFRDVMGSVLSAQQPGSSDLLTALTSLWFDFARLAVTHHQKDWDAFLAFPSSYAFDLLADSESSRQSKNLFLSKIIEADAMHFELDRDLYYTAWMQGLVQPDDNLLFEHELTKAIIKFESEGLSLASLHALMLDERGQLRLSLDDFKHLRPNIIKQVVRNIYILQFDGEDSQDFMESPLSAHQGKKLLKLMTDTMREQWRALATSDKQPYTQFVQAVLKQLRIYRYTGFEIDPWFIDPAQVEFPKEIPFSSQFLLTANKVQPVLDESLVRVLLTATLQAAGTESESVWVDDLTRALSANSPNMLDAEDQLAVNAQLQFDFGSNILPACIAEVFRSPRHALFARPIVAAALRLVREWHFRLDATENATLVRMTNTAVKTLQAVYCSLSTCELLQFARQGAIGKLIVLLLEVAVACTRRLDMLESMLEDTESNALLCGTGYAHANAIHELMTKGAPTTELAQVMSNDENALSTSKVRQILDEGLRGGAGRDSNWASIWRRGNAMAEGWEAWLGDEENIISTTERHDQRIDELGRLLEDLQI